MELDHIVGLLVEVQLVGPDVGVGACLVEVGFHHLQERDVLAGRRELWPAHLEQASGDALADLEHFNNNQDIFLFCC